MSLRASWVKNVTYPTANHILCIMLRNIFLKSWPLNYSMAGGLPVMMEELATVG